MNLIKFATIAKRLCKHPKLGQRYICMCLSAKIRVYYTCNWKLMRKKNKRLYLTRIPRCCYRVASGILCALFGMVKFRVCFELAMAFICVLCVARIGFVRAESCIRICFCICIIEVCVSFYACGYRDSSPSYMSCGKCWAMYDLNEF